MGATVTWCYHALWGAERPLGRMVVIDEGAALLKRPEWSEEKRRSAGAGVPDLAALARSAVDLKAPVTHPPLEGKVAAGAGAATAV